MSGIAIVHNLGGTISFISLIVLCFVLARRFARQGRRGWATYCLLSGIAFTVCFAWTITGGTAGALILFLGVVTAWTCASIGAFRSVVTE